MTWLLAMLVGSLLLGGGMLMVSAERVDMTQPANMRWLLVGQDLLLFILPALWLAWRADDRPAVYLRMHKGMSASTALIAIALILLAMPAINLIGHWNEQLTLPSFLRPLEAWMQQMEQSAEWTTGRLLNTTTIGALLANVGLIGFLAAMSEELTFRGVLLRFFTRRYTNALRTPHAAIWGVAILFSLIHFQFYGFIPRLLLGALLGYALWWTGSLWVPVLMHFVNNTMAVVLTFIFQKKGIDTSWLEAFGTGNTMWIGIVSLVVTACMIYLLRRSTTTSRASSRTSIGS